MTVAHGEHMVFINVFASKSVSGGKFKGTAKEKRKSSQSSFKWPELHHSYRTTRKTYPTTSKMAEKEAK